MSALFHVWLALALALVLVFLLLSFFDCLGRPPARFVPAFRARRSWGGSLPVAAAGNDGTVDDHFLSGPPPRCACGLAVRFYPLAGWSDRCPRCHSLASIPETSPATT
jgi:hypothetical protein